MTLGRHGRGLRLALCLIACLADRAGGQGRIIGTVHDSLSARGPMRGATVVLVERTRYVETDSAGRFVLDHVPAGRWSLALMHAVLDSFDLAIRPLVVELRDGDTVSVTLATPSAETAYADGCANRLSQAEGKSAVTAMLKIRGSCAALARRAQQQAGPVEAAGSTTGGATARGATERGAQALGAVRVQAAAEPPSLMRLDGFEDRRRIGMGKFITREYIEAHPVGSLSDLMRGMAGVKIENGTNSRPAIYLRGSRDTYCIPTFFIDHAVFEFANRGATPLRASAGRTVASDTAAIGAFFREISSIAVPELIKGMEVYTNSGFTPPQYDRSGSTGCGSVVIWTR